ncbi:hypothetical protein K2173_028566 [Erythroxylum novogranatense]|uniref:Uncharacterized protein n=1 Tax=Erythroxylum novogranatense TaxID=1862640 RepID=A0AAV8U5C7_9ROSI|nr:hypothetical protein K2173_028566 [Erythroxylum novogranatense]
MKGVGGPLLCIGDLLSDLSENSDQLDRRSTPSSSSSLSSPKSPSPSPVPDSTDLTLLFQQSYDRLNEAFAGTDHSWTALTLKLCASLETANKLVQSTNSNVKFVSEKVGEFDEIIKRGDSSAAFANALLASLNQKGGPSSGTQQ